MFERIEQHYIQTSRTTINLVKGGDGPPLLLLHGYTQTHIMWHKVSPLLAQDFTVVAAGDFGGLGETMVTSQTRHLIDTVTGEASRLRDFLSGMSSQRSSLGEEVQSGRTIGRKSFVDNRRRLGHR